VVHSRPGGDGRQSLRYRATYVFRVAVGDHRIVACDDGEVTFSYRRGVEPARKMTLDATELLRRFLQHVLPSGLQKVRSYGFLCPAGAMALEVVRWLIAVHHGARFALVARRAEAPAAPAAMGCPVCGGPLSLLGFLPAPMPAVFDTS
jgi:hypothetical protein